VFNVVQLKELKQELAMRDVLAGRGRVAYGDMDESQLHELRDTMRQACSASLSDIVRRLKFLLQGLTTCLDSSVLSHDDNRKC
jgi:hypothetical protein